MICAGLVFWNCIFCQMSDLASSPLITGDPDSREEKYRRRAPTDWFLRQAAAVATNQQLHLLTLAGGGKRWWSLLPRKGEEQRDGWSFSSWQPSPFSPSSLSSHIWPGKLEHFFLDPFYLDMLIAGVALTTLFWTRWTTLTSESVAQFRRGTNDWGKICIWSLASFAPFVIHAAFQVTFSKLWTSKLGAIGIFFDKIENCTQLGVGPLEYLCLQWIYITFWYLLYCIE